MSLLQLRQVPPDILSDFLDLSCDPWLHPELPFECRREWQQKIRRRRCLDQLSHPRRSEIDAERHQSIQTLPWERIELPQSREHRLDVLFANGWIPVRQVRLRPDQVALPSACQGLREMSIKHLASRAHRKNNHPKRAWRQVRLEIEGLDWCLCGRPRTGISMVAKSWNAARTGFPGLRSQEGLGRSFSRRACPGLRCRDARWWRSRLWRFSLVACPNVLEDRGDEVGILNAGDDGRRTAALGAGLDVNGENALQALHPNLLFADKVVKRVKFAPGHCFLVGLGHRRVGPWVPAAGRALMLRVRASARFVPGVCGSGQTRRGSGWG